MTIELPLDVATAFKKCGAHKLSRRARVWIANRVDKYGAADEGNNIGGLLCTFPHKGEHEGEPEQCTRVDHPKGTRYVSKFPCLEIGAAVLVAIARRASARAGMPERDLDSIMSGYRSIFPFPGEKQVSGAYEENSTGDVPPFKWSYLIPGYGPIAAISDALSTSDEARERFRLLQADWEAFEKQGVPEKYAFLRHNATSWQEFRAEWLKGNPDITMLTAQEIQANTVRRYIAEKTSDPAFDDSHMLKGGDIVDMSPGLKAASTIDKTVKEAAKDFKEAAKTAATAVPIEYKIGAAAILAIVLGALFRR